VRRAAAAVRPPRPLFRDAWRVFVAGGRTVRLLTCVALGTFAFSMQDVLLEPYGGQIMHFGVAATTALTALMALGSIAAFGLSARTLTAGVGPVRLAGIGIVAGVFGFAAVIFAAPLESALLFRAGTLVIGFGDGLFAVCTLTAAMGLDDVAQPGLALGAWGAVSATSEGLALAASGMLRDAVAHLAERGSLGVAMSAPSVPYSVVYHTEIALLFAALVALGPLAAARRRAAADGGAFGLADLPA
jgi:BCD family chlorophyll transporter-like MFS transporter